MSPGWVATVGYVRSLRIGSLDVGCEGKREGGYRCGHGALVDLSPYPDAMPLSALGRRLVCTCCGAIGAVDARPSWSSRQSSDPRPSWMRAARLRGAGG